jgi:phosphoribosylanthranilate isomerase
MTAIKICGLSRDADIDAVNAALPDYAGFVFAPSRRQVSAATAARLVRRLDERIVPVGVFVDAPAREIVELFERGVIRMAQLHGSETADYVGSLKAACAIPVIKAVAVDGARTLAGQLGEEACAGADFLLLDARRPGSGQRFDWDLLATVRPSRPYFLAGGIDEANIDEALALCPHAIDVSSGAETDGVKDGAKIRALVARVRAAAGSPQAGEAKAAYAARLSASYGTERERTVLP